MRAELHTWNRLSCPSGSGNFFIWLFSCLSSVVLSIIKTNNLHIRRRFITPPETDCISISYAKAHIVVPGGIRSTFCARMPPVPFLCPCKPRNLKNMDEMNRIRKITLTGLLLLFALLPLAAQERTDTVYTFRFVTGNDMFYVPFSGNDKELARLEECVERYRQEILAGKIPLHVDGWCTAGESEADNLAMAKVRSNRVKSELIIRQELTEACFITRNHLLQSSAKRKNHVLSPNR